MYIKQITEAKLAHNAYLIGCQETGEAIIVDPQRDIDRYLKQAAGDGLTIVAATETHIHADYLSGLRQLAELDRVMIYASDEGDEDWKYHWLTDSNYRYRLVTEGDKIAIGSIFLTVRATPGHTPEHIAFELTDRGRDSLKPLGIISGDYVFVGDVGRPDLLETAAGLEGEMVKSASVLFDSLQLFKRLAPEMMLWPGHGAGSACGKSLGAVPISTVGYELNTNPSVKAAADRHQFIDYILEGQPEPPAYFKRMKEQNRSGPPVLKRAPHPRSVATDEIGLLLDNNNSVIIDTRPWEDFRIGHLPGALFIPTTSAVSTLIGSYVLPEVSVCMIAEPEDLDEMIRHAIRVGVDKIDRRLTPDQVLSYAEAGGKLDHIIEINMSQVPLRLQLHDTLMVDVRRSAELTETGRIGGAYHIAHTQLRLRYRELPRDRNLHIYCRNANRSRYAAAFLQSKGYHVTHVSGGIVEWVEQNQPTEKV